MAAMTRKVGKYTRLGHRAHTRLPKGTPLAHGGNWSRGRSGGGY